MYWSTIRFVVTETLNPRPKIVTRKMTELRSGNTLRFMDNANELLYKHNGLNREVTYWSLPPLFVGNKLTSFEGNLTVTQRFYGNGDSTSDSPDLMLVGNGVILNWYSSIGVSQGEIHTLIIPLHSTPEWKKIYGGIETIPTRDDFLNVLSQIDAIYVKASPFTFMTETFLRKVTMDVAIPNRTPFQATGIEQCLCPEGYVGTSCESCDRGYYRDFLDKSKGELGTCMKCHCNGHEKSCQMNSAGMVSCLCKEGYEGNRCEISLGPQPQPESPIIVTVMEPKFKIVQVGISINLHLSAVIDTIYVEIQVGESVTLACNARTRLQGNPLNVTWSRENGQLPKTSSVMNGILFIASVTTADSGTYICSATDGYYSIVDRAEVQITSPEEADIQIEPFYPEATEGEDLQVNCFVRQPGYIITWTKLDGG